MPALATDSNSHPGQISCFYISKPICSHRSRPDGVFETIGASRPHGVTEPKAYTVKKFYYLFIFAFLKCMCARSSFFKKMCIHLLSA